MAATEEIRRGAGVVARLMAEYEEAIARSERAAYEKEQAWDRVQEARTRLDTDVAQLVEEERQRLGRTGRP